MLLQLAQPGRCQAVRIELHERVLAEDDFGKVVRGKGAANVPFVQRVFALVIEVLAHLYEHILEGGREPPGGVLLAGRAEANAFVVVMVSRSPFQSLDELTLCHRLDTEPVGAVLGLAFLALGARGCDCADLTLNAPGVALCL